MQVNAGPIIQVQPKYGTLPLTHHVCKEDSWISIFQKWFPLYFEYIAHAFSPPLALKP
jgi:hypothetical protein